MIIEFDELSMQHNLFKTKLSILITKYETFKYSFIYRNVYNSNNYFLLIWFSVCRLSNSMTFYVIFIKGIYYVRLIKIYRGLLKLREYIVECG